MRPLRRIALSLILLASYQTHIAAASSDSNDETLTEYVLTLGGYLGFDLTQAVKEPVATLLDASTSALTQQYSFITLLGAIPVNAYSTAFSNFVPSSSTYSNVNDMANYTYATQPSASSYNTVSSSTDNSGINVSSLIDQQTYQNDPVSQNILNMLTTPQTTYCISNDLTTWTTDCNYLYNSKIATNVIGTIPNPTEFFSYDYNQSIMTQLNASTLLGPLLYSTTNTSTSTSSSDSSTDSTDAGLTAQNQAQEANNFIRYATGAVTPPALPKLTDYNNLYTQAIYDESGNDATSIFNKKLAQQKIATYFVKLRTYAAQQSLPNAVLHGILARRMPQTVSTDNSTQTSQAFSEFQMATRRLYDPSKTSSDDKQWIDAINTEASTATVQKESAVLLAEMNYQLYLLREQIEKQNALMAILVSASVHSPNFSSDAEVDTQTTSDLTSSDTSS